MSKQLLLIGSYYCEIGHCWLSFIFNKVANVKHKKPVASVATVHLYWNLARQAGRLEGTTERITRISGETEP